MEQKSKCKNKKRSILNTLKSFLLIGASVAVGNVLE